VFDGLFVLEVLLDGLFSVPPVVVVPVQSKSLIISSKSSTLSVGKMTHTMVANWKSSQSSISQNMFSTIETVISQSSNERLYARHLTALMLFSRISS